jgi:glutamate synthase domain-containing protein 3
MVDVRRVDAGTSSEADLRSLVMEHVTETSSELGSAILSEWDATLSSFWEVVPNTKPLRERSQALVHVPQWSARLTSSSTTDDKIGFIPLTPGQLRKRGLLDSE